MMTRSFMAVLAFFAASTMVQAQARPRWTPLPGYRCMLLNITEQQSMDFSFHVSVRAAPSAQAPQVGYAAGTIAVRSPVHEVNGFVEMLWSKGHVAWIAVNMLRPYHSLSDPSAKCAIALSPDGSTVGTYDPDRGP